jgi:hypothetical protein
MKAAEIRASRAMTDCTLLTVVFNDFTTAEIDTFIRDVSTTKTNIAIASKKDNLELDLLAALVTAITIGSKYF